MRAAAEKIPPGSFPRVRCAACGYLHLPRDVGRYKSAADQNAAPVTLCIEPCGLAAVKHPDIRAVRIDG